MTPLSNEIRGVMSPSGFKEAAVFGIFTYIKVGLIAVCLIACAYLVWNYNHMKTVIAKQQIEIGNLKLTTDVLNKKQQTVDAFMAKKQVIQRRVVKEEGQVDATIDAGDATNVIKLFDPFRSHSPTEPNRKRAM
jgi:hypothetical protein